MTLLEAVQRLDDMQPNVIPREAKFRWLSDLDGLVWRCIIRTHRPGPASADSTGTASVDSTESSEGTGSAASTGGIRPAVPIGAAPATEPPEQDSFPGYGPLTDGETELLVPAPYDTVYQHYLAAQIDMVNGEIDRYNAEVILFGDAYAAFESDYNRTHPPKQSGRFRF